MPRVIVGMTREELLELATDWEPEWQMPLARHLSVAPRTVQRWAAGDTPIGRLDADRIRATTRADIDAHRGTRGRPAKAAT